MILHHRMVKRLLPKQVMLTTVKSHFSIDVKEGSVSFTLPFKTVSEANISEPWQKRATRHRMHKKQIIYSMMQFKGLISLPCTITMTRYGKKFLDAHDNLRVSFKHILDTICAEITGDHRPGRADGNPGFTFQYAQEKSSEYFVKILIEFNRKKTQENL